MSHYNTLLVAAPHTLRWNLLVETLQIVMQGGAIAVLLLVFAAILRGELRTKYEIDSWKARAERAEALIDALQPALDRQTTSVETLVRAVEKLTDRIAAGRS